VREKRNRGLIEILRMQLDRGMERRIVTVHTETECIGETSIGGWSLIDWIRRRASTHRTCRSKFRRTKRIGICVVADRIAISLDSMVKGGRHRIDQGFKDSRARERSETHKNPLPQYIYNKVN